MTNKRNSPRRKPERPEVHLSYKPVRVGLSPDGSRDGFAYTPRGWQLTPDEVAEVRADPQLAPALERPLEEWHHGVRVERGDTIYEVVPIRYEGRPALLAHSELATGDVLANDDNPLPRQRLAYLALSFLEEYLLAHGPRIVIGQAEREWRPNPGRPDDETLLRFLRDSLAADPKTALRQALRERFGNIPLATADGWLKHARSLPGANLPQPKGNRGRPRTQTTDERKAEQ